MGSVAVRVGSLKGQVAMLKLVLCFGPMLGLKEGQFKDVLCLIFSIDPFKEGLCSSFHPSTVVSRKYGFAKQRSTVFFLKKKSNFYLSDML